MTQFFVLANDELLIKWENAVSDNNPKDNPKTVVHKERLDFTKQIRQKSIALQALKQQEANQKTDNDETIIELTNSELTELVQSGDDNINPNTDITQAIISLHQDGKDNAKAYQGKGVAGILGKIGAYAQSFTTNKEYQSIDLKAGDNQATAFFAQGNQALSQLFGSKVGQAQSLASKLLPDDKKSQISDFLYNNINGLASKWALADLAKDPRFDHIDSLTVDEKQAFLTDIQNQNRGWAVIGGVAGFFGLKGVVLDTAWLLLIGLKVVHQTALIAGKPLTGADGSRLAFGIVNGANLEKMQEKQVLMTSLAIAKMTLKNAQSTGLGDELTALGNRYQFAHLDNLTLITNQLDKLNGRLVQALLPIGSALVAGYYNGNLIDEVIGVANASFADKTAKTDEQQPDDNATNTTKTNKESQNIGKDEQTDEQTGNDPADDGNRFWHSKAVNDKK